MRRRLFAGVHKAIPRCGEVSFDLGTAALSISDIVADIAVAFEFYYAGRFAFFLASVCIFIIAQASYAFLFAATYGGHLSNCRKVIVFIFALPLAQLVPIFTLIESFHLESISDTLRSAGLRPTSTTEAPPSDSDSLWQLLQRKYHAHAGFLVEALVEAIPQCALQIAAVVLARESSALNIFSILLSLAVIASKGWLAAYSLHRPTFLFNSICIAADVAGCFATAAWLAVWLLGSDSPLATPPLDSLSATLNGSALTGSALAGVINMTNSTVAAAAPTLRALEWTTPAAHTAAVCSALFYQLLLAGVVCGIVGGGGTILFSMADDHLKVRDPAEHTGIDVDSVVFNVYILRTAAWLLSILPCVTLLMLLRLSLLPLLAFKSLSSEHATHHAFFTALFAFLTAREEQPPPPQQLQPPPQPPSARSIAAPPAAADDAQSANVAATTISSTATAMTTTSTARPAGGPSAGNSLEERLATANALINLAHAGADELRNKMAQLGSDPSRAATQRLVRQWAASLGRRRPSQRQMLTTTHDVSDVASAARDRTPARAARDLAPTQTAMVVMWWELPEPDPPAVEALGRWARRYTLCMHAMRRRRRAAAIGLAKRSAVFRILTSSGFERSGYRNGCAEKVLFAVALLGLALVAIVALPAVAILLLLIPLGALFPILQLALSIAAALQAAALDAQAGDAGAPPSTALAAFDAALVLPWTLSGCFVACMLLLLLLAPRVHTFQSMRADIATTAGLPGAALCADLVQEMERRYKTSRARLDQAADEPWDAECCICIKYIEPRTAGVLAPCGHTFHHACIHTWLRGGRTTCPLCRAHACADDVILAHPLGEMPTMLELTAPISSDTEASPGTAA